MYVINPFSYKVCATCIVILAVNLNFLFASCWRLDVTNGACGLVTKSFLEIDSTKTLLFSSLAFSSFAFSLFNKIASLFFNKDPVIGSKSLLSATFLPSTVLRTPSNVSLLPIFEKSPFKSE